MGRNDTKRWQRLGEKCQMERKKSYEMLLKEISKKAVEIDENS